MATNFYFNNFQNSQEQLLIENLVIESIKIYGHDVKYLPRTLQHFDKIYGEDRQSSTYTQAIDVEMYIKNVEGFAGEGDFLSKFGVQIRDQITFTIARRVFSEEVGSVLDIVRPREGDLIFLPLNEKLFEIKFVEHEPVFYQMGALQMYDIKCELFEYQAEVFDTGVPQIDIMNSFALDVLNFSVLGLELGANILTEAGDPLGITDTFNIENLDVGAENTTIQSEAATFLDFTEHDPFSEGGTF